jgi:acylaminoacyl-peptidase
MLKLKKYEVEPLFHSSPASEIQISPDGKTILFVKSIVNVKENRYESHIWTVSTDGEKPRQFTNCVGNDTKPIWSPDGKIIYFLSNRSMGGKNEKKLNRLWSMSAQGGEASIVAEVENGIRLPQLSPDGKRFLFLTRKEEDSEARSDKESDVLWITKLRYKLNGEPFFPYTRVQLFVVNSRGGRPKQLTKGPFDISSACWSPDSKEIAFITNIEDHDHSLIRDVYLIPATGGEPHKVTDGTIMARTVSWSPNRKLIAYTGHEPLGLNYTGWRNTEIWVVPIKGGKKRNLTASFDRSVSRRGANLIWSPDSCEIYFAAPNHAAINILKVAVGSGDVEQVTEEKFRVSSFSKIGETIAFSAVETLWPNEVWLHDADGTRRLTKVNNDVMRGLKLSEPEEYWFTASDGVKIQGWIMKPLNYEEGKMYPTVVQVHGGPMGSYGYSLSHQFQILARHGYAVVYCNPRMSTGYGEEFAAQCSGRYGEKDYTDIMECVDYVLKNYTFVDADKMGVAGGSYGGWMTNWIVGHTDRFAAAVTSRSISNWDSFHGISDIGPTWVPWQVGFGQDPWETPSKIREKSPLTYVECIKTPLLIIHSEQDWRCPIAEGEQLYIALKKIRGEVEFIRFPDENHGLSGRGKPKHRIERLRHILRWFEKYLK